MLPAYKLKYQGRHYRIFKKEDDKDASWYIYFERDKVRYSHCLRTNVKANAEANARQYVDAVETARHTGRQEILEAFKAGGSHKAKVKWSTLGEIIVQWERAALGVGDRHRRQVVNALTLVFRRLATTFKDTLEKFPADVLNPKLVQDYCAAIETAGKDLPQHDRLRLIRSAEGEIRSAACLVQESVVTEFYKPAGLTLPDFKPFRDAIKSARLFKSVGRPPWNDPGDAIIKATLEGWLTLPKEEFLALGHALAFGLRISEILQVTWKWHTVKEGRPFLDSLADVKGRTGRLTAAGLDPFYTQLMERARREKWTDDAGPIVSAKEVFLTTSKWMRSLGWQTTKTNHALRDYSGSQVAMKYDLWTASSWLRHKNVQNTQDHYTHFLSLHKQIDKERLAVKWATTDGHESTRKE